MTKVCTLNPYDSLNIFKEIDRAAGSVERFINLKGNSLLSTVRIDRLDSGTVKIDYYEIISTDSEKLLKTVSYSTPGTFEFWTLPFHTQIRVAVTTTDTSSFVLKITCRTDGEVLRSSAFDGAPFDIADNKGLPIMCLDEDLSQVFFLRCKEGVLVSDPINSGGPLFIDGEALTTPGSQQTLVTSVVPVGKTYILSKIHISGSLGGKWIADIDSGIIGAGRIASGSPDSTLEFIPRRKVLATETLRLRFRAKPGPASDVNFHIMLAVI